MAVFKLEDALSVWTNLGKHSLFVGLYVSSIKTGTRRIIRLDQLSSVVRLERRTEEGTSSAQIMRLVPVFTLETNNQTNNECLPKFDQTDYASSSIKTANLTRFFALFKTMSKLKNEDPMSMKCVVKASGLQGISQGSSF